VVTEADSELTERDSRRGILRDLLIIPRGKVRK
jgi:hypothetical protein